MAEPKRLRVGDLISSGVLAVGDGYRAKNDELGSLGLPFCRAGNVQQGFNFVDADRFPKGDLGRVGDKVSQPGDVVFTSKGTVGRFARVRHDTERFVYSPQLCYWRALDRGVVDPDYLYYWMSGPGFRSQFRAVAGQTDMADYVSLGDQRAMWVDLPDLAVQQRVGAVLGALDDKIALNRRMSETLEATARALFKSWFVDFDPVRAKAEGRDSGNPPFITELFPDSLALSDIGDAPMGWRVEALSGLVDVERGLSYGGAGLAAEGLPMHNLNSIFEGGGYKSQGLKHYTGAYKVRHVARAGDVLVANTEQGHERRLIGYAATVPARFGEVGIFSHHIFRVRVRGYLTHEYLCQLLNTRVVHDLVSGFANGTTVNTLPMEALQVPLVVVPPAPLVTAFSAFAAEGRRRQEQLEGEAATLARLRDALLPKLLSGELQIDEAELAMEAVST